MIISGKILSKTISNQSADRIKNRTKIENTYIGCWQSIHKKFERRKCKKVVPSIKFLSMRTFEFRTLDSKAFFVEKVSIEITQR